MSITYNKFNAFVADICNKVHNLASDTCKVTYGNTGPTAAASYATVIGYDLGTAGGYTSGGPSVGSPSSTQSSGTETFSGNNTVTTATGAVGPFRYCSLYNSTASAMIAWFDYGSAITMANGDTFTIAWNGGGSSGSIFTLA